MVISKIEQLFSQYGYPLSLSTDNGPPFSSETFAKFLAKNKIDHITSSPHYPKSNGYIECQVKTIKTALATAEASGKTIDKILPHIRSTPIGPDLPSPREILHNLTDARPGKPSRPVNFTLIRNYLISQKVKQKDNHDSRHQAKPLPELLPGQQVLFLSPVDNKSEYIPGTILSPSSTPRSYKIEANGRIYCCTRQHIRTLNNIQPFTRPSASQYQNSTKQDNSLPRPPSAQNRAKTFISGPSAPPKPAYKRLPRPPQPHSSNKNTAITGPSTTNTNIPKSLITRPLSLLLPSPIYMLSYLSANNSPCILPPAADSTSTTSTSPSTSPATTPNTSRSSSPTLSSPRSSDEESDTPSTSSRESNTSIKSTASDRQLRPRIPISYNKTFLTCLHRRPQVKTLNNISIPLPLVSESEDSSDEDPGRRNMLLRTIDCKATNISLVKDINPL